MKKSIFSVCMLFLINSYASEIHVTVKGMVCGFCVQGIKKKISSDPAVENIHVDFDRALVTIKLKQGKEIDDIRLSELIKDAGFTASSIKRKMDEKSP